MEKVHSMTMLYLYLVEHQETGRHLRQCNGTTDRHEGAMVVAVAVAVAVRSSSEGRVGQQRQVMAGAVPEKAVEEQRGTKEGNGLKVQRHIGVAIDPIHVVVVLVCLTRITTTPTTTTKHRPKKLFPLLCPNGNP